MPSLSSLLVRFALLAGLTGGLSGGLAGGLSGGLAGSLAASAVAQPTDSPVVLDEASTWTRHSAAHEHTQIRTHGSYGGRADLLGDGALLLQKRDSARSFWHQEAFRRSGRWTAAWVPAAGADTMRLRAEVRVYGQPQDVTSGWTKFAGNPLVAPDGWRHNTPQTLEVPGSEWPQDQSLVRGVGPFKGQWLLFFNVGGWAVGGWAAAVADSLAPLKRGRNPFRLLDPYPLFAGNAVRDTLGYHAPNDWIAVDGQWYAPDESRDLVSRLWTSAPTRAPDALTRWTNEGRIDGMQGHDPGIVHDGSRFYLFTEDGERLQYLSTTTPRGPWTPHGVALDVGDHTGDADVNYFNNAWHLFFDDGPHRTYKIGYARTAPSDFPRGWRLTNDVYGPRTPDQGQAWDEPRRRGNRFGAGDADVAVEGHTLYLTHERPVGLAYKELETTDDAEQTVRAILEIDRDGDGVPDTTHTPRPLAAPQSTAAWSLPETGRVRLVLELRTTNATESPYLPRLRLTRP